MRVCDDIMASGATALQTYNHERLKRGESVYLELTRPWLNDGLFCSPEGQDPEPLRSSIAAKGHINR